MKSNASVIRKASPHPMATILSRVLATGSLLENSGYALSSSEVMRRTIAVIASQILRSESVKGIIISITSLTNQT
jgi:hypothetical protein